MRITRTLAVAGATVALAALPAAAIAAGTSVSVRVEGLKRTLLAPTVVHTHSGSITKDGAPAGSCPATNAAGALDQATRHNWSGTYSSGLGIEITKILGEAHTYSAHGYYWGIWINNRFAQSGVCDLKLHAGDHLLFAPAPGTGTVYPTGISGPSTVTAGSHFRVKVVHYNAKGVAKPLAGARVDGATSAKSGYVTLTAGHTGTMKLTANEKGYIRSAPLKVRVTG